MSQIRRLVHVVGTPRKKMGVFLAHAPVVHLGFVRSVVPLVFLRSGAIFARSWAQSAQVPGAIMGLAALVLQLLTWALFGWALMGLARLTGYHTTQRQAFALSTAVSVPLWLGDVFYLIPEDPPALFAAGRLAVFACGSWGAVMLAHAPLAETGHVPGRKALMVALSCVSYIVIYGLFFVTTGILATLATLLVEPAPNVGP